MAQAVVGTALVAGGAAVLNQVYERDTDALMRRTRGVRCRIIASRPAMRRCFGSAWRLAGIAAARVRREHARGVAGAGDAVRLPGGLYADEAPVAAATLVGAVPGALPPLIGWAAAHGAVTARRLDPVRDRVPVADPALHGDCLDVSRRLSQAPVSRCCR